MLLNLALVVDESPGHYPRRLTQSTCAAVETFNAFGHGYVSSKQIWSCVEVD